MSDRPDEPAVLVAVVDDEPMIGDVIQRTLKHQAQVQCFSSRATLLKNLEQGSRFHLILCDLLMPAATGREVYDDVLHRWPQQAARFVFMTGGGRSGTTEKLIGDLSCELLSKPFSIEDLRELALRYGETNVDSGS